MFCPFEMLFRASVIFESWSVSVSAGYSKLFSSQKGTQNLHGTGNPSACTQQGIQNPSAYRYTAGRSKTPSSHSRVLKTLQLTTDFSKSFRVLKNHSVYTMQGAQSSPQHKAGYSKTIFSSQQDTQEPFRVLRLTLQRTQGAQKIVQYTAGNSKKKKPSAHSRVYSKPSRVLKNPFSMYTIGR